MAELEYVLETLGITLDGKTNRSHPFVVEHFTRDDLAVLFAELGYVTGAEIGVEYGRYSETLCKANPELKLYSIDPWSPDAFANGKYYFGENYDFASNYAKAIKRLSQYKNCEIVRDYSMNASKMFRDGSLDFVYIDGNHDFQNISNDICEWERKVRVGGIVSGHDYSRYKKESEIHVKWVVDAYTYCYKIFPWFVIGQRSQSWFWVKQNND